MRRFGTAFAVFTVLCGVGLIAAIAYVPFLQNIFKTGPLTLIDWGIMIVAGISLFFAEEARKWFARRRMAPAGG